MNERILSEEMIACYSRYLIAEEKSAATCEKYLRDVRQFYVFVKNSPVTKELVIAWKNNIQQAGYAVRSINSMLASVNSLLNFLDWQDCKVKTIRVQRQIYCAEDKELTKGEYRRLLDAAQDNSQINLILQTICSTGIRVSELRFFTVEALERREITVSCKGKIRTIILPGKLRKMLTNYARKAGVTTGAIFVGKNKKPLDRSVIWRRMKMLCAKAGIQGSKVFPHNLRKLFACTFYHAEKDIVKLADILGHSSINTTRIYIMETGSEHRRKIERLGLLI